MKGEVKFFNRVKNFGFITGEDSQDYFVHMSSIESGQALNEKDEVEFEPEKNDRGLNAQKVKKL